MLNRDRFATVFKTARASFCVKFRSSTLIKRIIRKHCPLVSSSIRRIFYKLSSEKNIYIYVT